MDDLEEKTSIHGCRHQLVEVMPILRFTSLHVAAILDSCYLDMVVEHSNCAR